MVQSKIGKLFRIESEGKTHKAEIYPAVEMSATYGESAFSQFPRGFFAPLRIRKRRIHQRVHVFGCWLYQTDCSFLRRVPFWDELHLH